MVSKFIKRGTNKENVWEHGNIGQFGQEQGNKDPPPPGDPLSSHIYIYIYIYIYISRRVLFLNDLHTYLHIHIHTFIYTYILY